MLTNEELPSITSTIKDSSAHPLLRQATIMLLCTLMVSLKMNPILRRLLPLYIAAFFQGIPFWYAIEKLFMVDIGFTTASIGLMVAIMSVAMLAVETPSGILADRWSRKGVMIVGSVSLLLSGAIGALSHTVFIFIVSTVFWGIYSALYSGTYDSAMYDTVMEEHGSSKKFARYLGQLRAIEGAAFVLGALGGGVIASVFGMRDAFFLSLPLILLSIFFLFRFREPQLHKAGVAEPVFKHIRQTFAAVLRRPILLPMIVAIVGFSVLLDVIFELSQLWFMAVDAPLVLYGIFSAVVFSSWSIGGVLVPKLKSRMALGTVFATITIAIVGLIVMRNHWVILGAEFLLAVCLVALGILLANRLHDELPSQLRTGSSSVVSTLARLVLIPCSLLFTALASSYSIFSSTYLLLFIAVLAMCAFIFSQYKRQTIPV